MEFGRALQAVKDDKRIARDGWKGANQFIYYVPANEYAATTDIAKEEFGDTVLYGAYLAIKPSKGPVVPWLASQSDLLADDWCEVV